MIEITAFTFLPADLMALTFTCCLCSCTVHSCSQPCHSLLATDFCSLSLCFAATAQHSPARSWTRPTDRSLAPSIVVVLPRSTDQAGRQPPYLPAPPRCFYGPTTTARARLPVERRRPGEEEWGAPMGRRRAGQGSRPPDRKTEVGRKGSRSVRGQTIV